MIGKFSIKRLKQIRRLFLLEMGSVGWGCVGDQPERAEDLNLNVGWIRYSEVVHRDFIVRCACALWNGGIAEYEAVRVDETALPFGGRFEHFGPPDLVLGNRDPSDGRCGSHS